MSEHEVYARIKELVDTEHRLRSKAQAGGVDPATEQAELKELEVALDQCWDLLRQRRARIDAGLNPDDAQAQSAKQVEGYVQ